MLFRSRLEIESAKAVLEDRVRARTADLEEQALALVKENEERLRSEARTLLILKSAGEGVFGVDAQERVTFWNDTAARMLGYSAEELIGRGVHEVIHHSLAGGSAYRREDCPMVRAASRGVEKKVSDEVFWRKDGSMLLVDYSAVPIFGEKGETSGAVVVFRDVSAQKEREAEMRSRLDELERFNRMTVSREERMIELKKEINGVLEAIGKESKYRITE